MSKLLSYTEKIFVQASKQKWSPANNATYNKQYTFMNVHTAE